MNRRRANAPPVAGRPNTKLIPPKKQRRKEDKVPCPWHCGEFVSRQTVWRHTEGENIPVATHVSTLASSAVEVTKGVWKALQSKLTPSPNHSPASQSSSRLGSEHVSNPQSISSRVFGKLSALVSKRSPNSNPTSPHAQTEEHDLADFGGDHMDLDNVSDVEMGEPVSPRVEEWARNHHRATVEDVEDEDDNADMCGEGFLPFAYQGKPGEGLKDWDDDQEAEDYIQAQLERELEEIGDALDPEDIGLLRAFALKVEDTLNDSTFNKFKVAFPESKPKTYEDAKVRIEELSEFRAVHFDCCLHSCTV